MIVAVIGGDGFIGRRIVRRVVAEGHEAVSLDVNASASFEDLGDKVRVARMDLTSFEATVTAFATFKPEVVVNLSYHRNGTPPRPALNLNILGMDNCFEAARLTDVPRIVYSSSGSVNGLQRAYGKRWIREDDPPAPVNQYGVHKVFNEWQAHEYRERYGMTITGIRPGHVSGTDKTIGTVDHVDLIRKPAVGQPVRLKYRDSMRGITHCDDMAEIFTRLALTQKPRHTLYNTGGESISLGRIADTVLKVIPDADISFENETGDEENSGAHMYDNTRLVEEFGFRFMPYEERIPHMIDSVRRGNLLG